MASRPRLRSRPRPQTTARGTTYTIETIYIALDYGNADAMINVSRSIMKNVYNSNLIELYLKKYTLIKKTCLVFAPFGRSKVPKSTPH